MAEKLLLYYKCIYDAVGFSGKIDLAKATKLPSTQAAIEPDSPENIKLFREAYQKITGRPAPNV